MALLTFPASALTQYEARFGPASPAERLILTGRAQRIDDTVSLIRAGLFLLGTAAHGGASVAIFAPLHKHHRLEWDLRELGFETESVHFLWDERPWSPFDMAIVYRSSFQPFLAAWTIWLR